MNDAWNYEWDEEKRARNFEKHRVDFLDAAKIFEHPILEWCDTREDYGEDRWIAIGHWEEEFFVVVYTWREDNRRIISAWKAGRNEEERYYDHLPD